MSDETSLQPWQRPPFEPGNELSMTHGAWSPRRVDPLAVEILESVRPTVTFWTPADEPAVRAWARTEARIQLLTEWLMDKGTEVDAEGEVLGASNLLTRLERLALSQRSRLGLDPLGRSRLGRNVAAAGQSLAAAAAIEAQRRLDERGGQA